MACCTCPAQAPSRSRWQPAFNETTETTLRLAITRDAFAPCALDAVLPASNCSAPGFAVDLAHFAAIIALGPSTRLQVVTAKGYSFTDFGNESVLDLVDRGDADFTPVDISVTHDRSKRLLFTGPILGDAPYLFYRSRYNRVQLSSRRIFWKPLPLWLCLALTFGLLYALSQKEWKKALMPTIRRFKLFLLLILGLSFSLLSNYVCFMFAAPTKKVLFGSLPALRTGVFSGQYKLYVSSGLIDEFFAYKYPEFYNKLKDLNPEFLDAELTPGVFYREAEEDKDVWTIYLTYKYMIDVGPLHNVAKDISLPTTEEEIHIGPPLIEGIYYSANSELARKFPLTYQQIGLIRAKAVELKRKYFTVNTLASGGLHHCGHQPKDLRLERAAGILLVLAGALVCCSVCLFLELAQPFAMALFFWRHTLWLS